MIVDLTDGPFSRMKPYASAENSSLLEETIEGADRDGNRGVKVTWKTCPKCGREDNNA